MLGISASGTNESSQLWMAFWPALYSGIIDSMVTGSVVGLVVLFVQCFAEKGRREDFIFVSSRFLRIRYERLYHVRTHL